MSINNRLVSLMEILEVKAEAFWRLSSLLGQLLVRLETGFPPLDSVASSLGEFRRESEKLGLRNAVLQIDRISETVKSDRWDSLQGLAGLIQPQIKDLLLRVLDELGDRFFLNIPAENVPLYRSSEPLFGPDVAAKFSEMAEDIDEAGKCLALNRSTAAVFHLMRVVEIGVRRFGDKLGIELTVEKNWQPILDEINKAIKAMDHKLPQTKAYAATSAHLYNVKIAWRNEVMHPKQTYTEEEARNVFGATRTFIRDLASMF